MLHAEVVAHFVGHGGGHQADGGAVVRGHAARVLVGAHRTLQRFAHHAALELDAPARVGQTSHRNNTWIAVNESKSFDYSVFFRVCVQEKQRECMQLAENKEFVDCVFHLLPRLYRILSRLSNQIFSFLL